MPRSVCAMLLGVGVVDGWSVGLRWLGGRVGRGRGA
jgi:hypothetical protein